MAETKKTAAGPAAASLPAAPAEITRVVVSVVAPAGPRRRAGLQFGPVPINLTAAELGGTVEERDETMQLLQADPLLKLGPPTGA